MHVMNLGDVAEAEQKTIGPALARQLCQVLKTSDQLSAEGVVDTAVGPLAEDAPRNYAVVARVPGPEGAEEVWLRNTRDVKASQQVWILTRKSVSMIQQLYRRLVKKDQSARKKVTMVNAGLGKLPAQYKPSSPREAMDLFLKLARQGEFSEAARLLDLNAIEGGQQAARGERLARRLFMVLKRVHPRGYSRLSNDPSGAPEKNVPFDEEVVARSKLKEEHVQLRLARYPRKDAGAVWIFSRATVGDINALYKAMGYGWAGDYLPPTFFEVELWQVQLWQWFGLLVALIIGIIFGYLGSYITRKLLLKAARFTKWEWDDQVVLSMRGPLIMVFWVVGFVILRAFLALAEKPNTFLLNSCKFVAILALGWFLVRLVDVAASVMEKFFEDRDDGMAMAMVPVARKIVKTLISVIVIIVALQNMGMDVGGLLAGLGIGGLAFALAAKSTLENLFGGITIAFDRPFKVGDWVQVGSLSGTVEDLGLRSTRLRTAERTVVTIPNGQMMDSKIENYSRRDKIRILVTFGMQYDTTLDQMRFIVDEFKRYLLTHSRVLEGFRVRFVGFGDSSMDIEVMCYISSTDFTEFSGIREEIYLELGKIVARAGAEFAFPSQTVYVGKDSHADDDKADNAAQTVAAREQEGELCIPDIPESVRQKLVQVEAAPEPEEPGKG